jgi:hypothetical protein
MKKILALILIFTCGSVFAQKNYVTEPALDGKKKYTNYGDFKAMATTTPSLISRQYISAVTTLAGIQALPNGTPSLMLVADDINITSGNPVTNWTDRIQGTIFTQAVAGNRPLYYTSVIGGRASVRNGAGVTQYLSKTNVVGTSIFGPSDNYAYYCVFKNNSITTASRLFRWGDGVANNFSSYETFSDGKIYEYYGNGSSNILSSTVPSYSGAYHLKSVYVNGVSIFCNYDSSQRNVFQKPSTLNIGVTLNFGIMATEAGANCLNGDLAFLLIFPRYIAPGSAEDILIYNSIAQYYNLPSYPSSFGVIQEWWNGLGSMVAKMTDTGKLWLKGGLDVTGPTVMRAFNDSDVVQDIYPKTTTGTGNTTQWRDTAGAIKAFITSLGVGTFNAGITTTTIGASGTAKITGPATIGGPVSFSNFEADGTYVMVGGATVWNDIQWVVETGKVPASSAPDWSTFNTDFSAFQFKAGDYMDIGSQELIHSYKEGTDLNPHIHWATGGTNADARAVKWDLVYTWCRMDATSPYTEVFSAPLTLSKEVTLQAGVTALSHIYTDMGDISGAGVSVGTQLKFRLRRQTAVGTAPTTNPFALQVGVHVEEDTIGSRTEIAK